MSIITLLTDFGIDDEYVGLMKGVILSIDPTAVIVDITHQIDPQDLVQAAYVIKSAYRFFPKGSVHLIVVDPGVGGRRAIIAVQMMEHVFVAPDNGVLTLLAAVRKIDKMVRLTNHRYFLESISPTFHGRDIIAPAGAHLAKGVQLSNLGPEVDPTSMVKLPDIGCRISESGELVGKIVSIDRFGNLITNIDSKSLTAYCQSESDARVQIRIGYRVIFGLADTYASAGSKIPLALIGSRRYLEVAVNQGSAKQYFNAKKGDTISVISNP
jgi:S-adenosylmethionine hydrolase